MGTYYNLGIIRHFSAAANQTLTETEWEKVLNDRLDLSLFDVKMSETNKFSGSLKKDVFEENIHGFYDLLRKILGEDRNENIDYYEDIFYSKNKKDVNEETDFDEYDNSLNWEKIKINSKQGPKIVIEAQYSMLFIEGKVQVEEFYTEPILMNYLFRNSNIKNPLAGCVISGVTM